MVRYIYIHTLLIMIVAAIGFAVTARNASYALYQQKQETANQEYQAKMYREQLHDLQSLMSLLFRSDLEETTKDRLREFIGRQGESAIHCKIWDLGALSGVPSSLAGLSVISVSEARLEDDGVPQKHDEMEVASVIYSKADDRIVDIRILTDSNGITYGGFGVHIYGIEDEKLGDVRYEVTPTGFRTVE